MAPGRAPLLAGVLLLAGGMPVPAEPAAPGRTVAIKAMIVAEARDLGVDPALALAVAHAESGFLPAAQSPKGARGLMQVMPATCRGEYALHPDVLWQPRLNVRIGLHFLRRLLARYDQEERLALSYYNGGARVGSLPDARPIPATLPYVRKVLKLKARYARELAPAQLRLAGR